MINYKSELINKILEQRGHEKSSLHYESECIESWINEAKGAYPKLTDYESEWLNYMVENPIGEFPYETIIDVTDATVDNVVPYAYKSAILKGDSQRVFSPTKNLFDGELEQGTIDSSTGNNSDLSSAIRSKNFVEIGVNTAFTLSRKKGTGSLGFRCYDKNKNFLGTIFTAINAGTLKVTYTTDSNTVYIRFIDNTNDLTNKYQIEIGSTATDYEEPNYELKSVKMPVLKTTGKNLFDGKVVKGYINDNGTNSGATDWVRTDYFPVEANTDYYFSVSPPFDNANLRQVYLYDENKKYLSRTNRSNKFRPSVNGFVRCVSQLNGGGTISDDQASRAFFQIAHGTDVSPYEPYKSNILTVNEPIELRGIGEVQDTLDLISGEIIESVGEVVLNGSESWKTGLWKNQVEGIGFEMKIKNDVNPSVIIKAISDKILYNSSNNFQQDGEYFDMVGAGNGETWIRMRILRSKLSTEDVEGFKKWLSQNNVKILYELSDKPIKTVDLSVIDQDGNTLSQIKPVEGTMHISTDGTPLKPTVSMEIPVEAITQNLTSFIEEE